jgi:peptidoglycan/LPS O-acetylase OafA/YrhL
MKYIKQLDAIRAIAVIMVICAHWIANEGIQKYNVGYNGVDIFFVLSGFLITTILLKERLEAEKNELSNFKIIKNFIFRRTLRIFPIYYIFIFSILIIGNKIGTDIKSNFIYYFTYTSNLLFFLNQSWDGIITHLWSLAVEEQFYLLWPWVIVFIPKKMLLPIILFFIALGISSNFAISYSFPGYKHILMLTPTCFDAFGIGAILAYFSVFSLDKLINLKTPIIIIGVFVLLVYLLLRYFDIDTFLPRRTYLSIFAASLIVFAQYSTNNIINRYILSNKILIFIGKISYGIYLFHNIVPWLYEVFFKFLDKHQINIPLINCHVPSVIYFELQLFEMFCFLIFLAWFSWYFFESRINKLKIKYKFH